jgi:hypothetical protein
VIECLYVQGPGFDLWHHKEKKIWDSDYGSEIFAFPVVGLQQVNTLHFYQISLMCIFQSGYIVHTKTLLISLLNSIIGFVFILQNYFFTSVLLDWQQSAAKCLHLWEKMTMSKVHDFIFIINGIYCVKSKNATFLRVLSWLPESWALLTILSHVM